MNQSLYAGFDLGGTQLKYGLISQTGDIVFEGKAGTPPDVVNLMRLLETVWEELAGMHPTIGAAGFGFPGVFNLKEQRIRQSPNYPDIDNFDLRPALDRFMNVPYWINNDANMAAFGEFRGGSGRGAQTMVLLTIGTGVGSGLILNGELYQGSCGFGGELGHAVVNPDGDVCNCGSYGCLETEVSASKIVKNYKGLSESTDDLTSEDVYKKSIKGDQAAREAFAAAGRYLGIGLALAINLLNPERIILGGGVMKAGDLLHQPAIREAERRSFKDSFNCCSIVEAELGNRAGFVGSAHWARRNFGQEKKS